MALQLKTIEVRRNFDGVMEGKVYFADSDVALSLTLNDADIAKVIELVSLRMVSTAQDFAAQMLAGLNGQPQAK